jgi:hypothetical protein
MISIRRLHTFKEERHAEAGRTAARPLRRLAVVAVVNNPYAGRYVEDLKPMIDASVAIGQAMAEVTMRNFGNEAIQSYGKGGIVGLGGEQEHANAMLTTAFANPFRDAIGGADAWISSFTKIGAPGTAIDIPMNHKDDVYVRSHYDGMSISIADTPQADEIALIFCVANRGRLNARVGGLTHEEVVARKEMSRGHDESLRLQNR